MLYNELNRIKKIILLLLFVLIVWVKAIDPKSSNNTCVISIPIGKTISFVLINGYITV